MTIPHEDGVDASVASLKIFMNKRLGRFGFEINKHVTSDESV